MSVREDIHAHPHFSRSAALEVMMGSEMVVAGPDLAQCAIELIGVAHGSLREHGFHGADEALDSSILPGTAGINALRADAQEPQRQAESPRGEDRFVIGPHPSRRVVSPTGLDQVPQHRQGRLVGQPLQPQAGAAGMIQDRQHQMLSPLPVGLDQQIHTPDEVAWHRPRRGVFELPARKEDGIVMPPDRVRDIGFADSHLFADGEAAVKEMRDGAAARVRHKRFEADDFAPDPRGFRVSAEATRWSAGPDALPAGTSTEAPEPASHEEPESCALENQPSQHQHRVHLIRRVPRADALLYRPDLGLSRDRSTCVAKTEWEQK